MVEQGKDQWQIDQGTGELVRYDNTYDFVKDGDVKRADEVAEQIIEHSRTIELHYLKLAQALSTFNQERLYLAKGFPSFRTWAESNEISGLSYRTAHNLLRIADEALPILQKNDAMEMLPSVSTMYDLLPILSDDNAEEKFIEAVERVQGLTNRDAKAEIREIRGIDSGSIEKMPTVFSAKVTRGDTYHRLKIYCSDGEEYYDCTPSGPVVIKPEHFARFEERFGRFIEIT